MDNLELRAYFLLKYGLADDQELGRAIVREIYETEPGKEVQVDLLRDIDLFLELIGHTETDRVRHYMLNSPEYYTHILLKNLNQ